MTNDTIDAALTLYKRKVAINRRYQQLLRSFHAQDIIIRLFEPYFQKYPFIEAIGWYQWFDDHEVFQIDDICLAGIPNGFTYMPMTVVAWVHSSEAGSPNEAYVDNFDGITSSQVEDLVLDTDFYEEWLQTSKEYLGNTLGAGDVKLTRTGELSLSD